MRRRKSKTSILYGFKVLLVSMLCFVGIKSSQAQWMLINESGGQPNSSAVLELRDTTRGFLPTRISQSQMNAITSPASGLMVYNTDSTGYYFYNGTSWVSITTIGETQFSVPTGSIIPFGGDSSNVPTGFLLCAGQSLDTTSYSELFAAIGYAWGGSGANFNTPDLRGRFMRGTAYGNGNDPDRASRTAINTGGNTGDEVGSVQGDQFQSHRHTISRKNTPYVLGSTTDFASGSGVGGTSNINGGNTGGSETRPINANVNFIVCYSSSMAANGGSGFQGVIDASSLPSGVADTSKISDGDNDTYVEVEETTDDDQIRFYSAGTEIAKFRNGNLGIGVANPGEGIHITGSKTIRFNSFLTKGDTGITFHTELGDIVSVVIPQDSNQVLRGDATFGNILSSEIKDDDEDTYIRAENTTDNDSLIFVTGGTQRMVITPDGNVGIGLTDPIVDLDIEDTTASIRVRSTKDPSWAGLRLQTPNSNYLLVSGLGNTAGFGIRDQERINTPFMIDSSGFIGVGTITPLRKLHIEDGSLAITDANGNGMGHIFKASLANRNILSLRPDTALAFGSGINLYGNDDNLYAGQLRFYTSGGDQTPEMLIDSTGNLGLGTTNPSAKLDVVGDVEIPAANDYTYAAAKTKHLHIPGVAYTLLSTSTANVNGVEHASTGIFTRIGGSGGNGKIAAPIHLPDSAQITELRAYLNNNSGSNVTVEIFRYGGSGAIGAALAAITQGNTGGLNPYTDNTITNATIDNQNFYYYVVYSAPATATFTNAIYGTRITYTVEKAD